MGFCLLANIAIAVEGALAALIDHFGNDGVRDGVFTVTGRCRS